MEVAAKESKDTVRLVNDVFCFMFFTLKEVISDAQYFYSQYSKEKDSDDEEKSSDDMEKSVSEDETATGAFGMWTWVVS